MELDLSNTKVKGIVKFTMCCKHSESAETMQQAVKVPPQSSFQKWCTQRQDHQDAHRATQQEITLGVSKETKLGITCASAPIKPNGKRPRFLFPLGCYH